MPVIIAGIPVRIKNPLYDTIPRTSEAIASPLLSVATGAIGAGWVAGGVTVGVWVVFSFIRSSLADSCIAF